jgi:hypothetical protein
MAAVPSGPSLDSTPHYTQFTRSRLSMIKPLGMVPKILLALATFFYSQESYDILLSEKHIM